MDSAVIHQPVITPRHLALDEQLGGHGVELQDIDVARFAHDLTQWRPAPVTFHGSQASVAW